MRKRIKKPILFVSVGSLTDNKNMDNLIRAFRIAVGKYPEILLRIYGDGPRKRDLKNRILDQGLEKHVFLEGVVNRDKLAKAYMEADYFVLVSHAETFGVSYIEAMAAGLPVIAGMSGGPEDFITKENGLMINEKDVNQIADALCFMIEHGEQYHRERISADITEKYSGHAVAVQLADIYSNVISLWGRDNAV